MYLELSILTLNVWGIPYVSKDRQLRIEAIGQFLAENQQFDVISLQEVWTENNFQEIKKLVENVLPYAHYFYSGVFGSGLCVLSKYPIVTTLFHAWSVNGYVHRIQHGDWFGGKGVGLCQILVNGYPVNIYTAHLHAEYDRESDDYNAHRVVQAFDTAQFIQTTRGDSILQVLAGDLNTEPGDLAYRVLLASSHLVETYSEPHHGEIGTNECAHNTYTASSTKKTLPKGKRIDYILYRSGENYEVKVLEYNLPLPECIPNQKFSYSDHEAVHTKLLITDRIKGDESNGGNCILNQMNAVDFANTLREGIKVCDDILKRLKSDKRCYLIMAFTVFFILMYMIDIYPTYGWKTLYLIVKVIFCGITLFFIFMATLWNSIEHNGILSSKLSMEMALEMAGVERQRQKHSCF